MPSLPLSARLGDPVIDTVARSIFTLFPRCMVCGETIACYEDADVRILSQRVVHREPCTPAQPRSSAEGP